MTQIAALLTVFNRRDQTLEALRRLFANTIPGVQLTVTLLDDGSTDGTAQAVTAEFPGVEVVRGDGSHFWNGGMRAAWQVAAGRNPDFYLWLNDDTLLDPGAVERLLRTSAFFADRAIVVGSTRDAVTGEPTYGGVRRGSTRRPLRFQTVVPGLVPQRADTMNGNCVLVPRSVVSRVGILSAAFTHGMGDFDYGLRAKQRGVEVWVAPGFVGTCTRNQVEGTWQDASLPRWVRWSKVRSVKALPPREWATFTSRHGGPLWWLTFMAPYARVWCERG